MSWPRRASSGDLERMRRASRSVAGEEVQDGPRSRRIWGMEVMVMAGGLFVCVGMVVRDEILVSSC